MPGLASRHVGPRAGLSVVFGAIEAGSAPNAIPSEGMLRGTVRTLSRSAWKNAEDVVRALIEDVVSLTRAEAKIDYIRGVPPVANDATSFALLRQGMSRAVDEVVGTPVLVHAAVATLDQRRLPRQGFTRAKSLAVAYFRTRFHPKMLRNYATAEVSNSAHH